MLGAAGVRHDHFTLVGLPAAYRPGHRVPVSRENRRPQDIKKIVADLFTEVPDKFSIRRGYPEAPVDDHQLAGNCVEQLFVALLGGFDFAGQFFNFLGAGKYLQDQAYVAVVIVYGGRVHSHRNPGTAFIQNQGAG